MSPTGRLPKTLIAAMLAPFAIALAVLVYEASGGSVSFFVYEIPFVGPLLLLALPIALAQGRLEGRGIGTHARRLAAVSPCLLAPLSVIYPWTVAAGGLGPAAGGFPFFIDWLTKYPNWGPINYEVLLGILCVLGASSIPVAFAMYYVLARPPRMWVLGTILALDFIAFIPLMIYLDIYSIRTALEIRLGFDAPSRSFLLMFAFGPLLRVVPVLVMPVLLVLSLRQQPSAPLQPAGNVSDQSA